MTMWIAPLLLGGAHSMSSRCGSHVSDHTGEILPIRAVVPIQYSESDWLAWIPGSKVGRVMISNDSGLNFDFFTRKVPNEPESVWEFETLIHHPGNSAIAAYNNTDVATFSPVNEPYVRGSGSHYGKGHAREIDTIIDDGSMYTMDCGGSFCFMHIINMDPSSEPQGFSTLIMDPASICAYGKYMVPFPHAWCVSDKGSLVYHQSPGEQKTVFKHGATFVDTGSNFIAALVKGQLQVVDNLVENNDPKVFHPAIVPADVRKIQDIKNAGRDLNYMLEFGKTGQKVDLYIVTYHNDDKHVGLWSALSEGREFVEKIRLHNEHSVWRVGQVLYAKDDNKQLWFSVNNGVSWENSPENLKFNRLLINSERASVAYKSDKEIAITYDGVNWSTVMLPHSEDVHFEFLLADYGSLLISSSNSQFWAYISDEWVQFEAPEEFLAPKGSTTTVFALGAKLFFITDTEKHVLSLAETLEINRPCAIDDLKLVAGNECILNERRSVWQRKAGTKCFINNHDFSSQYRDCDSDTESRLSNQAADVTSKTHFFEDTIVDYMMLPSVSESPQDETLLVWTSDGSLYVSQDQGTNWVRSNVESVLNVFKSDTKHNQIYAISSDSLDDNKIWVSWDQAHRFQEVELPGRCNLVYTIAPNVVSFHPQNPDWMVFSGSVDCEASKTCPNSAFVSKDRGKTWTKFRDDVLNCQWIGGLAVSTSEDFMYCYVPNEQKDLGKGRFSVKWSDDYFQTEEELQGLDGLVTILEDKPFLVAGYVDEYSKLHAAVSRDGVNFEEAKYPPNIDGSPNAGLVLIKSQAPTVTLYEGISGKKNNQFGSLIRSGGIGTNFVSILKNVNRAAGINEGYADIDYFLSSEGSMVANVVLNAAEVMKVDAQKQIGTFITHSNGAKWARIQVPKELCTDSTICFLNLHGHSERLDMRNTPSSPSAVGMFFGRGNVGGNLGDLHNSQTFMTRDGGVTWRKVSDRPMFWEFGDSGSILIMIDSMEPTDSVMYSLDEGESWNEYRFSNIKMKVKNIITIPSDTSRKFVVIARPPIALQSSGVAIQIDFSQVFTQQCKESDFVWWSPKHPQTNDQCLLGHKISYYRRRPDAKCFIGKAWSGAGSVPTTIKKKTSTCECSRNDYECDYGFELDLDTTECVLVNGISTPNKESQCQSGAIAWHEVTGYRKLTGSSCKGGKQLDKPGLFACPGREADFKKQYPDGKQPEPPADDDASDGSETLPPSSPDDESDSNDDDNGDDDESGGIMGVLGTTLIVCFFLGGFMFMVLVIDTQLKKRGSSLVQMAKSIFAEASSSVHLPDSASGSSSLRNAAHHTQDMVASIFSLIKLGISKIPFMKSNHPYDNLGFYSRMDDEERMRILDSDNDFDASDFEDSEHVSVSDDQNEPRDFQNEYEDEGSFGDLESSEPRSSHHPESGTTDLQ